MEEVDPFCLRHFLPVAEILWTLNASLNMLVFGKHVIRTTYKAKLHCHLVRVTKVTPGQNIAF